MLYLKPDLIRRLKKLALDDDTHLYLLLEPVIEEFIVAKEDAAKASSADKI